MKKTITLFYFLCCLLGFNSLSAQVPNLVVSPQNQCFSASGTSATAYVQPGVPSATSYSWSAFSDSCNASVTSFSGGVIANITYPCCGNYTIVCAAFSGSTPIAAFTKTALINCIANASVSISGPGSVCNGGTIVLYGSGSTNYTWMPGGSYSNSISVTPSTTTCYTLYGWGCSGISTAVKCVTVGTTAALSVSGATSICAGYGTTLTASGASSYTWYTSQGTYTGSPIVLSPTATTCYSLIGTTSSGCTGYSGGCITVNPLPNTTINSSSFNLCAGSSSTLYASGASTYTWFPSGVVSSSLVVSPSVTTCYTLVGYSCFNMASAVRCVTVSPASTVSINTGSSSICAGSYVTLNASGASTYTWYPGNSHGVSLSVTPSVTTCYTLTGSGCSGVSSAVQCVTVSPLPTISVSGNSVICSGDSTVLTASGGSSYYWYSTGTYTNSIKVTPTASTCYSVVGFSAAGCYVISSICVNVSPNTSVSINGATSVCSGSYVVLYANGGGSYTWSPGSSHSPSIVVTPTSSTCYTLSGSGCSGISSAVKCVSVMPNPTVSVSGNDTICAGHGATLTASGASSYTWFTSQGTFTGSTIVLSPSATACYSLMGTNSQGCPGYSGGCIIVQNGTNLTVSGSTNICSGASTTLTAGGAQTYTWFPSGYVGANIALSPTATTCFTLVGYSNSSCGGLSSKVVCVSVNTSPLITTSSPFFCEGQSNTLHASGASSYTWYPYNLTGANIAITPSVGGCYTVVGTSSTGCNGSAIGCFSVIPTPSLTISGNNLPCAGAPTTLTAAGAQSYTWFPSGSTGSSIVVTPLSPTCYTVVGNAYGCNGYAVKCLSVQTGPTLTTGGNTVLCAGDTAILTVSGALSYTWLPGNITGAQIAVTPSASTCYTVVGTNSTGCVSLGYRCLQLAPKPNVIVNSSSVVCNGHPIHLSAIGATTYTWLPFNLHDSIVVVTASVSNCYTVFGTNAFGCTNSVVGCYSVMPSPSLFVTGHSTICAGSGDTLIAGGATSYTWLPGNLNGPSMAISPSVSTCYTVIGSNGNCTSTFVKCITVQSGLQLNISGANLLCSGASANLLVSGASTYTWSTGSNSPFISVTPTAPTCYSVIGTTSGGCLGSAVKCISVQATPVITITGPAQVCSGSSAILNASGASSYIWSSGSTSNSVLVLPYVSSVYSVTGSNGVCSSTKSYTLVVNPKPSLYIFRTDTVFNNDSLICAGEAVHLMANGANSYTWSNGSTSPYITVTPGSTSSYTVSGINSYGCIGSSYITLYISACTGLSKHSENLEIGIYPNPSSGQLLLQSDKASKINYSVYDVLGRELLKGEFTDTKNLNLSGFTNGTYIIRFESGNSVSYKKVILENK